MTRFEVNACKLSFALRGIAVPLAKARGEKITTSRAGKISSLLIWSGVGTRLTAELLKDLGADKLADNSRNTGRIIGIGGAVLSAVAAGCYLRDALK